MRLLLLLLLLGCAEPPCTFTRMGVAASGAFVSNCGVIFQFIPHNSCHGLDGVFCVVEP